MHSLLVSDREVLARRLLVLVADEVADLLVLELLRRTLVAVGVQVFGQFSGINVINYFGPSMYRALGLSAGQSLLVQGIYGAVGPITNFLYVALALFRARVV